MNAQPAPAVRRYAAAYRRTAYCVALPGGDHELRVGRHHPAFDRALGAPRWAFLTAVNPRSRPLGARANRLRQRALAATLRRLGVRHHPARGVPDARNWPPEDGFLLAGVRPHRVRALARRFGQNAVVAGAAGRQARLVFC